MYAFDLPTTARTGRTLFVGAGKLRFVECARWFLRPSDVLFVMTTNHVESLDSALLRPGRIDYKLYLGKATDRQKAELYCRFFPSPRFRDEAREFVETVGSAETMAECQGVLLGLEQDEGSWEMSEAALMAGGK